MCQWFLIPLQQLDSHISCNVLNSTLFSDCHYITSTIIELLNCICFVLEHLLESPACPSVTAALDVTQRDMALGLSHETAPNPVQCNTIPHFYSIHNIELLKEAFTCPQRQYTFSHISSMWHRSSHTFFPLGEGRIMGSLSTAETQPIKSVVR